VEFPALAEKVPRGGLGRGGNGAAIFYLPADPHRSCHAGALLCRSSARGSTLQSELGCRRTLLEVKIIKTAAEADSLSGFNYHGHIRRSGNGDPVGLGQTCSMSGTLAGTHPSGYSDRGEELGTWPCAKTLLAPSLSHESGGRAPGPPISGCGHFPTWTYSLAGSVRGEGGLASRPALRKPKGSSPATIMARNFACSFKKLHFRLSPQLLEVLLYCGRRANDSILRGATRFYVMETDPRHPPSQKKPAARVGFFPDKKGPAAQAKSLSTT